MAVLGINFDANAVAPQSEMGAVPPGWYNVMITESEMKPTSKKDGSFLALTYTVMDGEFAKRKLFENLNLQNKSETAVEIARACLSAICHAIGVFQIADSQQLHGIPFQIKVGVEPAGKGDDGKEHDARNSIKGYKALEGAAVAPAGGQQQTAPAWAQQTAPAAPAAPLAPAAPAPVAPPAPAPSGLAAAIIDGWQPHPSAAGYHWKGQDVVDDATLASRYPVAPVAPVAPPVPAAPAAPAAVGAPPWQQQPAAPANAAPAAPASPQPTAATTQAKAPWEK